MLMRSQIPIHGVGRFAAIRGLSIPVKTPNAIRITIVAMEYRRNLCPNATAPNPIASIMRRTVTIENTMCMASVSVDSAPRRCIGARGQTRPMTP
jgi:hypothetical protein